MEELKIDINSYKELSHSYLNDLSGEKILTFHILDQNGEILFEAGHSITISEVEDRIKEGKRFFIPRIDEQGGSYSRSIINKDQLDNLAKETAGRYKDVRKTGSMSYEQYINSHKSLLEIVRGLKKEDKNGGMLSLLQDVEEFDYYTYVHSVNVGILSMILSHKMGLSSNLINAMSSAGYLHDIGKLRVPLNIINKPGRLSRDEYITIMEHSRHGYKILDGIVNSEGQKVVPKIIKHTALFHHRRYRSSGYPVREFREKGGEQFYMEIPSELRLIGICDMYDAITTSTPYRTGGSIEFGLRYILNLSDYYFTIEDVHRFLRPMSLSLNKGKSFLFDGEYIVVESSKTVSSGKAYQKVAVYEFARIISSHRGSPLQPVIRVFYDINKRKKIRSIEIDLRHDHNRKIARVLHGDRMTGMMKSLYH